jgi:hypothetical protein
VLHHPGSQPFLDEPQNSTIRNAVLDKLYQPPVVDGVEEPLDRLPTTTTSLDILSK